MIKKKKGRGLHGRPLKKEKRRRKRSILFVSSGAIFHARKGTLVLEWRSWNPFTNALS